MTTRTTPREAAIRIVRKLQRAGHVAYLAGGCVRDRLLGLDPKDYDVATDATPDVVKALFSRAQLVGEAFGVVLVRITGGFIEVATFRSEWGYSDGRRPDGVKFTDARTDAQRRDFTVNGLFEDPINEEVIDWVGGQDDLRAGVLRAIGDPDQRFSEDYLRMLRAARFAARLGFEIEARTARAIRNLARYLGQISRERIGQEVQAMLMAEPPKRHRGAVLVQDLHLDGPTLNEDHADPLLATVQRLVPDAGYPVVLGAWMVDRHAVKPGLPVTLTLREFLGRRMDALVQRWRRALMLSNDVRDTLRDVLHLAGQGVGWPEMTRADRKRWLAKPNTAAARQLLAAMAHCPSMAGLIGQIDREAPALEAEGVAPPRWVNGDDLLAMGLRPGPAVGKLLEAAYDRQLEGDLTSREAALQWLRDNVPASGGH